MASPLLFWLKGKGLPSGLVVVVVVAVMIGILFLIGVLVGGSVNLFVKALPSYQERLQDLVASLVVGLRIRGVEVSDQTLLQYFDPSVAMRLAASLLTSLGGLLRDALLILLAVIFMLLEAFNLPEKLAESLGDPDPSMRRFAEFAAKLKRYVAIKTAVSIGTGTAVAIWLTICQVDFPFLWGLLAFLLNYIPNLGSISAAIPPVLLALIQFGPGGAALVAGGYAIINFAIGSLLEPRFLGQGLGLSTLVVFISLVVWAWVLGPVGALLSVPLTITLKLALESSQKTRWLALILGSSVPAREETPTAID
jgi:predicted PurR-regulated permease PerM